MRRLLAILLILALLLCCGCVGNTYITAQVQHKEHTSTSITIYHMVGKMLWPQIIVTNHFTIDTPNGSIECEEGVWNQLQEGQTYNLSVDNLTSYVDAIEPTTSSPIQEVNVPNPTQTPSDQPIDDHEMPPMPPGFPSMVPL